MQTVEECMRRRVEQIRQGEEAEKYYTRLATVEGCLRMRLEQRFRFHWHRLREDELERVAEEMMREKVTYPIYPPYPR
jgi:hypothetical protein